MSIAKRECSRRQCTRDAEVRGLCHSCYNLMRDYGQLATRLIDATPVRHHIEQQVARGRPCHSLAADAGVVKDTAYRVLNGRQTRLGADLAARILAVPLPPTTIGAIRRVQALARAGWGRADVAEAAGTTDDALRAAMTRRRFHPRLALALAAAYERIPTDRPGPSPAAARLAAAKGHPPVMAWEGVDIDDPAAVPDLGAEKPLTAEYLRGEVAHLTGLGMTPERATRKLGVTAQQLAREDRTCGRCGDPFLPGSPRQAYCDPCGPLADTERHHRYRAAKKAARNITEVAA